MILMIVILVIVDYKQNKMNIGKQVREHKKLVEELLELATIITQQLNKPKLDLEDEITKEIGDVKWRISQVEKYYNINEINNQIQYKNDRDLVGRNK